MARQKYTLVGKTAPRVEAWQKVTGGLPYADDLTFPGMLSCKILRSTRPHAKILSIDTSAAEKLPGVHAIVTGKDLPVNYGIMPIGEDEHALAQEKVRFVGDGIVGIAADDEATAEAACKLVKVEYEDLEVCMSVEDALAGKGEVLHHESKTGNIHKTVSMEFGDMEAGFAAADYVREDLIKYSGSTHLPMEQHSAIAVPQGGDRLILYTATQNPHYVHKALAKTLRVPAGHLRVVATPVGGGFGGKCDPFPHEIVSSKLALITGRPVKCTLTREEVFYNHRGRHGVLMYARSGWTKDGKMTAMHFRTFLDGGSHASYGVASTYYTGVLNTTTYQIPAYKFEALRAFTNKPPCGPKRGHGVPQPRFAVELHLDKVANDLGINPAELRRRNTTKPFTKTVNYLQITSNGLDECLEAVVKASGYEEKRGKLPQGRGIGLAVSAYLTGAGLALYQGDIDHSQVWVRCDRFGGVTVFTQATEIGQGSHTVHAALVAEVLGLRQEDITLVTADTAASPVDLGSYSSRVTFMSGNAALEAAGKIKQLVAQAAAAKLNATPEEMEFADGRISVAGDASRSVSFADACFMAETMHGNVLTSGSYRPPNVAGPFKGSGVGPAPTYSYSAAAVEIEADPETGFVTPVKVWIAHDIGKVINPTLALGQVEGSVYMGLSEALMEEDVFRKNLHKTPSMLDYKTPTTLEMPEVETIFIETVDPEGPFGAKEAGQGPMLPVVPALNNAIYDALGVWIDEVPASPEKVLKAMDDKAAGGPGRVGPAKMPANVNFGKMVKVEPPVDRTVSLAERR